jgi:H+/Cl- antiporter ClcA
LAQALVASWLCVAWVPQATGSGIGRVKAYLNGIRDESNYVASFSLFFVKVVGTILSVSSGLAVGQEGPLIHIGAIMGSGCSRISHVTSKFLHGLQYRYCCCHHPNSSRMAAPPNNNTSSFGRRFFKQILNWTTTELNQFATHAERRDLVSIGASCGFAASFGAPIGGLLFMLDDISTYFSKSLLLRILVANMIGTFCLAVQHGNLSDYSVINLGGFTGNSDSSSIMFVNRVEELPLIIFIGIAGGVLGGLFCKTTMFLRQTITKKWYPPSGVQKWQLLLEVALVSILTSVLIFYLPTQKWACKVVVHTDEESNSNNAEESTIIYREAASRIPSFDATSRHSFFCPPGEINELANMLFGSRIEAIKRVLTDPAQFEQETLLAVGVLFYVLMTLTFGIAIPSGIFTPTVLIGASLGGAAGIFFQEVVDPNITPSTFALLGVAALLAGIQRSTVSVAVILVEGTGAIKVLMPAIITVVISRYGTSRCVLWC